MAISLNLPTKPTPESPSLVFDEWNLFCQQQTITLIPFNEDEIKSEHDYYKGAWFHSHYCFIKAYQQLPTYDYYWFIEYDARFLGSVEMLLRDHEDMPHDLLGTDVRSYHEDLGWWWWYNEEDVYMPQMLNDRWHYFPALTRTSKRLLEVLVEKSNRYHAMVESFVATFCADTFGSSSVSNLKRKYWTPEGCRYRPIHCNPDHFEKTGRFDSRYQNQLMHPIKFFG